MHGILTLNDIPELIQNFATFWNKESQNSKNWDILLKIQSHRDVLSLRGYDSWAVLEHFDLCINIALRLTYLDSFLGGGGLFKLISNSWTHYSMFQKRI